MMIDFDLRTMVEETVEGMAGQAHGKGLELICLINHDVSTAMRGDPGRLRQILTSLVGNAITSADKGEVIVRVTLDEDDGRTALVRFEVAGTGMGIAPDGIDPGLAVSSDFTARLEKRPQTALDLPEPRVDLRGLRVLVVDDNETNRTLVQAQSLSWGMLCDGAASGPLALERLTAASHAAPYDLVILDLLMPQMDGLDLARRIRSAFPPCGLRVIMMTSIGMRGHASQSSQAGIDGYVTKPVRQSQLYDVIATVMGKRPETAPAPAAEAPRLVTVHNIRERKERERTRILIAEDNEVNQMAAARMLGKLGYRADLAANGRQAVEAVSRMAYDLVLMDCQMPEMDGFEATRAIRNAEADRGIHTPIIAMTADAMTGDRERCLEAGMDDYISKPVRKDEMAKKIQEHARRAGRTEPQAACPPQVDAPHEENPLDSSALDAFMETGDDAAGAFLTDLIGQFLAEAPMRLAAVREAVAQVNLAALTAAAHSLNGSSATMGARDMSALCADLEKRARSGAVDGCEPLVLRLEDEFVRVRDALKARI